MPFDKTKLWVLDSRRPITESSRGHTRIFQTADLMGSAEPAAPEPRPSPGSVTRIMPIEQLLALPPLHNTSAVPDEAQQPERPAPTSRATQLRRVFALAALMLTGALQLIEPSSPHRPQARRAHASAPVASTVEPTLVPAAEPALLASPPEKKPRRRPTTVARDPLQRSAVDAVAAGDYRRAISAYDQLAAREPTQLAYHEAARILRLRLSSRAR